jgi:hypothetical protein
MGENGENAIFIYISSATKSKIFVLSVSIREIRVLFLLSHGKEVFNIVYMLSKKV